MIVSRTIDTPGVNCNADSAIFDSRSRSRSTWRASSTMSADTARAAAAVCPGSTPSSRAAAFAAWISVRLAAVSVIATGMCGNSPRVLACSERSGR